ncbi:PAS domain S-box protein [Sphingomonas ginkgonis]|uniref:histidine kinase n=1 Tax=Sphingomonas ginkgonis TaxID=2315330 RepID=A0A3S0EMY7_9SPHN|nr:HWE histidine kinase domain-containing protein [Sphingomonas ginkgonis]RST31248.1 PAS domain S-box protein [Sphingomonas ginkgonis]
MDLPRADGSAESAELRRRLAEAEETLRAIREGEVDALVIRGAARDEVFALGSEDSYRTFMETMEIGAAALDADGKLVYVNAALQALLGAGSQELQHADLVQWVGPAGELALRRLIDRCARGGRHREQLAIVGASGERTVEVTAAPLELAFGRGYALTFTDVTERFEAVAASEGERIGHAVLALSNDAVVVCNAAGTITQANAKVRQFLDGASTGLQFDEAFPLTFAMSSGLLGPADLVELARSGSSVGPIEAVLRDDAGKRTLLVGAGPLRGAGDGASGSIITLSDVTDQRAAERRQRLLMGELTHRVKNTLTLVLSIANRTIAGSRDLAEFRTAFGRRLEALAATHNLLAEDFSAGLTLEDLAVAELTPYIAVGSERLTLEGLQHRLNSDTAVALGLIFHELVTNAVKYGALSNERGRVSLTAERSGGELEIIWCEEGGPTVLPPSRHGFGQTLILRGLGSSGPKPTTLDYRPEGVLCRMHVATSALIADADPAAAG